MNRSNSIIEPQNKLNLSISEAAAYSGIGMHTLRRLIEQEDCDFVLHVGNKKKLIKRKKKKKYLSAHEYI